MTAPHARADGLCASLLNRFELANYRQRCGSKFRFGLFAISDHDMGLIAEAMGASLPVLGLYGRQTAD